MTLRPGCLQKLDALTIDSSSRVLEHSHIHTISRKKLPARDLCARGVSTGMDPNVEFPFLDMPVRLTVRQIPL